MNFIGIGVGWRQSRFALLACCAWQGGCASPPPPSAGPAVEGAASPVLEVATDCEANARATAYQPALLRIGCDGELLPGRATWSVQGPAVTLDFGSNPGGPVGGELVRTWPPLNEAPWLGHRVETVMVMEEDRVRVAFSAPADDPARLFADPRLSGVRQPVPVDGDARDAIDAGTEEVVTHHDASIRYARSLGRPLHLVAFDRLYLVAFARGADPGRTRTVAADMARDWVEWGAPGTRRPHTASWAFISERCGPERGEPGVADAASTLAPTPARPTVSYPEGDLPARQVAERLVSAWMRGGTETGVLAELTGSGERLGVRAAGGPRPSRAPSDVAAVLRVHSGPGHPCSLYAEVLRAAVAWDVAERPGGTNVLLLGELAAFAVGEPGREQP